MNKGLVTHKECVNIHFPRDEWQSKWEHKYLQIKDLEYEKQVSGFLWALRFPRPIKLTADIA
jgi:hypothetical protein